jgi:hypothetical protein
MKYAGTLICILSTAAMHTTALVMMCLGRGEEEAPVWVLASWGSFMLCGACLIVTGFLRDAKP